MAARIVVTEFVSLDGVMEAPGASRDSSTRVGPSSSTAETTGISSSWTRRGRPTVC